MSEIETAVITCENVTFRYEAESVLQDVSFAVAPGDYLGLVGSNGGGKTTLLKVLLGLLSPTAGQVRLFGTPIADFREWQKIGYVPQNVFRGDLNFPATVREVVESGQIGTWAGKWHRFGTLEHEAVDAALELAEMRHLADKRIGELSGGERQRVFIARALVSRPELLILDEPTANIDTATEEKFYAFLGELNAAGMTIVLVSHDLEAIARQVKTVLCLNRRLVCYGPPENLHSANVLRQMYGEKKQILRHQHSDAHV